MSFTIFLLTFAAQGSALDICSESTVFAPAGVEITGRVFFGNKNTFDPSKKGAVATVRPTDVYRQIPAYKKIVEDEIEKGSACWNKLMEEATRVFKGAIKKVGKGHYVLIVEEGGISGYPVTDITSRVIDAI